MNIMVQVVRVQQKMSILQSVINTKVSMTVDSVKFQRRVHTNCLTLLSDTHNHDAGPIQPRCCVPAFNTTYFCSDGRVTRPSVATPQAISSLLILHLQV